MTAVRSQRGILAATSSTPVVLGTAALVVLAAVGFFLTGARDRPTARLVTAPAVVAPQATLAPRIRKEPRVVREATYVVVFNNSATTGLAGRTGHRLAGMGWNVVGSDNWYGTIPATTVYYPPRLAREAEVLARDLGVRRVKPAIDPMAEDRLTLILTAPLS